MDDESGYITALGGNMIRNKGSSHIMGAMASSDTIWGIRQTGSDSDG